MMAHQENYVTMEENKHQLYLFLLQRQTRTKYL